MLSTALAISALVPLPGWGSPGAMATSDGLASWEQAASEVRVLSLQEGDVITLSSPDGWAPDLWVNGPDTRMLAKRAAEGSAVSWRVKESGIHHVTAIVLPGSGAYEWDISSGTEVDDLPGVHYRSIIVGRLLSADGQETQVHVDAETAWETIIAARSRSPGSWYVQRDLSDERLDRAAEASGLLLIFLAAFEMLRQSRRKKSSESSPRFEADISK